MIRKIFEYIAMALAGAFMLLFTFWAIEEDRKVREEQYKQMMEEIKEDKH